MDKCLARVHADGSVQLALLFVKAQLMNVVKLLNFHSIDLIRKGCVLHVGMNLLEHLISDKLLFHEVVIPMVLALSVLRLVPRMVVYLLKRMVNLFFLLSHLPNLRSFVHARQVASARVQLSVIVDLWKDEVLTFLVQYSIVFMVERHLSLLMPRYGIREMKVDGVLQILDVDNLGYGGYWFADVSLISKISWQRFLINFLNKIRWWANLQIELAPKLSVPRHKLNFN